MIGYDHYEYVLTLLLVRMDCVQVHILVWVLYVGGIMVRAKGDFRVFMNMTLAVISARKWGI